MSVSNNTTGLFAIHCGYAVFESSQTSIAVLRTYGDVETDSIINIIIIIVIIIIII